MNVPGANLLSMAMRVIQPQSVQWQAFTGRTVNSAGDWVSTFAAAVPVLGSIQPIPRTLYADMGLQLSRNYADFYTSAAVQPTGRDREGDRLTYGGKTWQAESETNWASVDGFRRLLLVEVPA
jgi:hypothetical protein